MPPEIVRFLEAARPMLVRCFANLGPLAWQALLEMAQRVVNAGTRIDGRLFTLRAESPVNERSKIGVRLIVGTEQAQVREVTLDGHTRRMYRVGRAGKTVQWIAWTGRQLGKTGAAAEREYPVFVQSHALHHLQERANLPAANLYLHMWLAESMAQPVIVERQGRDLLVEYRLGPHRVGYLVATPLHGSAGQAPLVAVRTFLFLTMQGTPESRQLAKQLKLTRRDIDWLGLHELAAFTQTDLGADPELRGLLQRCGCGHLFALAVENFTLATKPFAGEMRKYLQLAA
jgi:hypothetical protein